MIKQTLSLFSVLLLALVLSLGVQTVVHKDVVAGESHNLFGFAWSENIGWISFNSLSDSSGVDYGVNLNNDNTVTGYAWSENVGWIKFDNSLTGPGGVGPAGARLDGSNNLVGWARICSGTVNRDCASADRTDGWKGWIQLSGTWDNGVHFDGTDFRGFAWSDDIGWIDFYPQMEQGVTTNNDSDFDVSLMGKKHNDGGFSASGIVINESQAEIGVDVSWKASGNISNVDCSPVSLDNADGLNPINTSNLTGGEQFIDSDSTSPNLTIGANTFVYECTHRTSIETKSATLNVTVTADPQSCGGTLPSDASICSGDGSDGTGSWNQVGSQAACTSGTGNLACQYYIPTCEPIPNATICPGDDVSTSGAGSTLVNSCSSPAGSAPKCQFTCKEGYSRTGNVCKAQPIFIEI